MQHEFRKFARYLSSLLIFLALIGLLPSNIQAQQVVYDSLGPPIDSLELLDLDPQDSLGGPVDYLPPDVIFIPSDVLYNNSWDNDHVRIKRMDLSEMEDTVEIIFNNPSENPFTLTQTGNLLSPFGYRGRHFHAGVDQKLSSGDTVVSCFDGKVRLACSYRGYGNVVVIRHFNGIETLYGHLSRILVRVNQDVSAGDVIGLGGSTGRSSGPHLHFETRFLGEPFDPQTFIDFNSGKLLSDTLWINNSLFRYGSKSKNKSLSSTYDGKTKHSKKASASKYYKIRKGDTLSAIAVRNGTTVKKLCKLNRMNAKTMLRPGRKLRLR